MSEQTHHFRYESPFGPITVELRDNICLCVELGKPCKREISPDHPVALWLRGYFLGQQLLLPPVAPPSTLFQKRLRNALLDIPTGETRTYGEVAKALRSSPRAVGQALGANPLPLLIPCHRVVAMHGLGGFSGGEGWKEKLLEFEGAM